MITILDCINQMIAICDRLTTTTKKPDIKEVKTTDVNEKKLCIAIENGEAIRNIYFQIKDSLLLGDNSGEGRYKYWEGFLPDVAIAVLNTVESMFDAAVKIGYNAARMRKLINDLTEVVKPFRVHKTVKTAVKTLGLKSYQFNPYAVWVNSFSDHKLPYKVWLQA
ncbi:hypothetical protein Cl131_gp149 [Aphanizomenon phage vB_AphaS-CL131]|nr:hypothetical protein Cl131_gp149 [Aphanizomenon phage vB_AphaS-CL131]